MGSRTLVPEASNRADVKRPMGDAVRFGRVRRRRSLRDSERECPAGFLLGQIESCDVNRPGHVAGIKDARRNLLHIGGEYWVVGGSCILCDLSKYRKH